MLVFRKTPLLKPILLKSSEFSKFFHIKELTSYISLVLKLALIHFMPPMTLYTPWKLQKTSGFVIFRGYIKRSVTGNALIWFVNLCVFLAYIYLFKVNIRNTRKRCEICSKLIIKTSERRQRFKTNTIQSEYKNNLFMNYERVIDATQNIPESTK